jgi:predicted RNase H-like nuclease (RuvC/YqgF family)
MKSMLVKLLSIGALILSGMSCLQAADSLGSSIEIQRGILKDAATSQARIEQLDTETQALLEQYRKTTRELDSLKGYDDHLERMVQEQADAISELERQLDEIAISQREVVPLMSRMVQSLSRFIELDVPFLLEERRQRVAELAAIIDSPEISVAEKYRRILEAYRIELEYGRSVAAYLGALATAEGERAVEFLRVGRVVFIYRTLDGSDSGIWDPQTASWTRLPEDYQLALNKAFRVARKQAAPDLLQLPVFAPEQVL